MNGDWLTLGAIAALAVAGAARRGSANDDIPGLWVRIWSGVYEGDLKRFPGDDGEDVASDDEDLEPWDQESTWSVWRRIQPKDWVFDPFKQWEAEPDIRVLGQTLSGEVLLDEYPTYYGMQNEPVDFHDAYIPSSVHRAVLAFYETVDPREFPHSVFARGKLGVGWEDR